MSKKADSVTSEIRHLYEDTVRDSLARVFRLTFGTLCRQPDAGFRRIFNKSDTSGNLWWSKKPQDIQVDTDVRRKTSIDRHQEHMCLGLGAIVLMSLCHY